MLSLPRLHLAELEDQKWFPDVFRKGVTDYLCFAANRAHLYKKLIPVLMKGLDKSPINRIVDLCSGGGGGIREIHHNLEAAGLHTEIVLTDKYPNLEAFRQTSISTKGKIRFIKDPVDATRVPKDLTGFRTQFISFHHFRPEEATLILADAVNNRVPIGIFEATGRNWKNLIAMFFTPLAVMLSTPFIRPFSLSRFFWTYCIPVIPLCTMWDGIISVFRTYTEEELLKMTENAGIDGEYTWETGTVSAGKGIYIIYLLGYPVAKPEQMRQAA